MSEIELISSGGQITLTETNDGQLILVSPERGRAGKSILNGEGAPDTDLGTIGDFYIDTLTTELYGPKASGGWGSGLSLIGSDGDAGEGIASGGTTGQVLVKNSNDDFDTSWANVASGVENFADLVDLADNEIIAFKTTVDESWELTAGTSIVEEVIDDTDYCYRISGSTYWDIGVQGSGSNFTYIYGEYGYLEIQANDNSGNSGIELSAANNGSFNPLGKLKFYNSSAPSNALFGDSPSYALSAAGTYTCNAALAGNLFYVRNTSVGNVTISQNTNETFNGAASIIIPSGKMYLFLRNHNSTDYHVSSVDVPDDERASITFKAGNIEVGTKDYTRISYACEIESVTVIGNVSGSVVVDVWKRPFADGLPTVAHTITASAKPTLSAAQTSIDTTLTGWTKTINAGDALAFNVDSFTTIEEVTVILGVRKL